MSVPLSFTHTLSHDHLPYKQTSLVHCIPASLRQPLNIYYSLLGQATTLMPHSYVTVLLCYSYSIIFLTATHTSLLLSLLTTLPSILTLNTSPFSLCHAPLIHKIKSHTMHIVIFWRDGRMLAKKSKVKKERTKAKNIYSKIVIGFYKFFIFVNLNINLHSYNSI